MTSTDRTELNTSTFKVFNAILLFATLILGVAAFLGMMEIVTTIGALVLSNARMSNVQGSNALASVRNFYMLIGGGLMVAFVIGGIEHYSKRLETEKTRSRLIKTLVIEVVIIAIGLVVSII